MPVIQLEALDTLFFRDGKPFTMGEDNFAEGAFPPSPSVIYGALRTAYIAQHLGKNGKTIDDLIRDTEGLVITDIGFEIGTTKYFPMPLDYAQSKEDEEKAICLTLEDNSSGFTSAKTPFVCISNEHIEQISDGLFNTRQLINYLEGHSYEAKITKWSSEITLESKFGNSRGNETRSTSDDDGNVYRVGMRRLAKDTPDEIEFLRIIVDYSLIDLTFKESDIIRVGGEGKSMLINNYEADSSKKVSANDYKQEDKYFKVYFSTPSFFKKALKPAFIDDLNKKGYEIEIIATAIGKPLKFGGWDVKNKEPKPMLNAVPSGSVYYFKINNPNKGLTDIVAELSINSLSEFKKNEGFGLFKIAHLKFNENLSL